MRVVSQLGLDEQMIEAGSPEERMEFWSTRGRRLATFEVGDWGRETGFPMVSIRRGQGGGDHAVVVDSRPLRELAAPRSHARPRCRDAHRVSVVREPTTKRFCAYEV
jgi:hypothetical protein